jgi:ferredoxin
VEVSGFDEGDVCYFGAGLSSQMGTCSTSNVSDETAEIVVDWDECEANAVCEGILPEIFKVDENDHLQVSNFHPPADLLDKVQEAVDMCPKRALKLNRPAP